MQRNTGFVLLAAMTLFLGLLLIPTTQADRSGGSNVTPGSKSAPPARKADASGLLDRLTAKGRKQQESGQAQDQAQKIQPETAGEPNVLDSRSALSAAVFTTVGGIPGEPNATAPMLLANNDGREDFVADRAQMVFSPNLTELRTAISEHTFANGFGENVYYWGDTLGNLWVGTDTNPTVGSGTDSVDVLRQVNIPTLINTGSQGGFTLPVAPGLCNFNSVAVTGIAVNPVADLSDFGAPCGTIGEIVYVSILDTEGCSSNAANQPIRTRILAFAFTDGVGAGAATPVPTASQIFTSPLSNSGIAVDDDGSLYFHLVDLLQFTGGAIFKAKELAHVTAGCPATPRINRTIVNIPTVSSINSAQGIVSNPILVNGSTRLTNYSGPSATWGNIVALAAGPGNSIYAAMSRSLVAADDPLTQNTEGRFSNPSALGATPSMIISFADVSGAQDSCTTGDPTTGTLPIADGFADVAQSGQTRVPGVNNFRPFVLGNGPDIRSASSPIAATSSNTLKLDMQIDFTMYAGITVDEEGTVYVISGGTPAGTGLNPSPGLGEILAFPDCCAADRRADFIDLRGDSLPNPPAAGGNVGDGDSDRFDHIYLVAPLDQVSRTPTGLSGMARGFLRYTNRLAPNAISTGVTLGQTGGQTVLGDDATTPAPIFFGNLDPSNQVAGGDDQNTPFRGDDSDGVGNPPIPGALNGGFEFTFGGGGVSSVWNGFFLNSNGSVTFGAGDTDATPTVGEFRSGLPKIAPAWADLNPSSRATNLGTFPVQALGFTSDNAFKVRWINVPEKGSEACTATAAIAPGSTNTFAVTLLDDGVGVDENANQPLNPANPIGNNAVPFDLQEGPTDLRFARITTPAVLVGGNTRRDGSGNFFDDYSRMDLIGSAAKPVISGYSIGGQSAADPPGLCETNLGEAARSADVGTFGVVQSQTSNVASCLIGEGTEPTLYELFNSGTNTAPDFDLRFEGNDPVTATPVGQLDLDRGSVGFFGVGSVPPASQQAIVAIPDPFVTTPTTTGIINAIGPVTLNIIGVGFFPNEVTTVCGTPGGESGPRAGKTVTTGATLSVDVDGNGIPEAVIPLTNVQVISQNLIKATLAPAAGLPGSPFPLAASGGTGIITVTTTFTAGDNNAFGPFTRTSVFTIALGTRAPVVTSVVASSGNCGSPQTLALTGGSFQFTQSASPSNINATITDVIATEIGNPANVFHATSFTVVDATHLSATFNFGGASSKAFLIQAVGTGGTSRDLITSLVPGIPAGNEAGNLITFTCGQVFELLTQNYSVGEGSPRVDITVSRLGDTSGAASVGFATSDTAGLQNCDVFNGIASSRCDYEITIGNLQFAAGETSKSFSVAIIDDSYAEGNETFTASINNASGAALGALSSATVTIVDNDVTTGPNPIDDTNFFVRQQYLDFLGREPDPPGFTAWVNTINNCSGNTTLCDRVHVSQLFFQSQEFQSRGYFVYRFYPVSFGRKPDFSEFVVDMARLSGFLTDPQLEAAKTSFIAEFMARPAFVAAYNFPSTPTGNQQYVDKLLTTAAVTLPQRQTLIDGLNNATLTRAQVLRQIVESSQVFVKYSNQAFAVMEYFGYLRRDPDALYLNFILMLDQGADPRTMVSNFVNSTEYRMRFGPP